MYEDQPVEIIFNNGIKRLSYPQLLKYLSHPCNVVEISYKSTFCKAFYLAFYYKLLD